mmetsp:Transcript_2363/g.3363  ORF Transcript_2363/g.3363 Transcript_2363/m.3363 type:complete len:83 (+) Transcript_2363:1474-1722(+)
MPPQVRNESADESLCDNRGENPVTGLGEGGGFELGVSAAPAPTPQLIPPRWDWYCRSDFVRLKVEERPKSAIFKVQFPSASL